MDENKQKALAAALGQIEKQFGKGSIMRLGDNRAMDVETISPVLCLWISRWVLVVYQWDVSLRSSALNLRVKRH